MMQYADNIQSLSKDSTLYNWVIHFFGIARSSSLQTEEIQSNIDWPDSELESEQLCHGIQHVSGGYNEAFVVQYWTSYHPR